MEMINKIMKIKFLIFSVFLFLILIFPQTTATTVELNIDKEKYTVGETIHVILNVTSSTEKSTHGSVIIYETITETKSKQYHVLFATVPCAKCAVGVESIDMPFHRVYSRRMNDPGNYYIGANFGGVEKKIFFNVSGYDEEENETENETIVNETIKLEYNITENITEINETINITINETTNLTNKTETKIDRNETEITEKQDEEEYFKLNYFMIILIIVLLVIVISAVLIILVFVRKK